VQNLQTGAHCFHLKISRHATATKVDFDKSAGLVTIYRVVQQAGHTVSVHASPFAGGEYCSVPLRVLTRRVPPQFVHKHLRCAYIDAVYPPDRTGTATSTAAGPLVHYRLRRVQQLFQKGPRGQPPFSHCHGSYHGVLSRQCHVLLFEEVHGLQPRGRCTGGFLTRWPGGRFSCG